MSILDAAQTVLKRRYLFARQQFRHLQAGVSYLSGQPLPETRFVLFGRGRSGTTALVSMLDDVPGLRCAGEVLHNYVPFPYRHILGRAAGCSAEAYGCKVLSYQIKDVQRPPGRRKNFLRTLHYGHGFQILYLHRENLVRHALSNIRARRETFHRKKSDLGGEPTAIYVNPNRVLEWLRSSQALRRYEEILLTDVPHLSLTYEEHIRHADDHQTTVDLVCDFLEIASGPVESSYRKVAPSTLRDRVANYDELARRLDGTPYAKYLNEDEGSDHDSD
ncbi:Nodulation protein H [Salinibacter grassmerensis]|uniref:Nodulation protein H n=1 Tax=Salinibacter grassmerensis TaxID=3040353 RepID=UPI0021E96587|nr:Nodulation protein H [Salinibacter grassmerensis]